MAASCSALTSISKGCANNLGGLVELYLWDMLNENSRTEGATAMTCTALVVNNGGTGTTGSTASVSSYALLRNTANFTDEASIDVASGSTFYTQTINIVFPRREATKSASIKLLADGQRDLGALVKDANNNYWVFKNLQLTAVGDGSGTAKADGSKYTVTLSGQNEYSAFAVGATNAANFILTGAF